jgi:hypothetical protein
MNTLCECIELSLPQGHYEGASFESWQSISAVPLTSPPDQIGFQDKIASKCLLLGTLECHKIKLIVHLSMTRTYQRAMLHAIPQLFIDPPPYDDEPFQPPKTELYGKHTRRSPFRLVWNKK